MTGSTVTLIVTLVLALIALYGAFAGIRSREVAKTAIDQLTLVSAALDFERAERKTDKELLLRIAKELGITVDECIAIRDKEPERWAEILRKFGLDGKDGAAAVAIG